MDPNSVVNVPPHDIVIKGGEVLENQPVGSLVAKFIGQDNDPNDTLVYSLVFENKDLRKEIIEEEEQAISDMIFPFRLAKRGGGLRTRRELNYETDDHNYTVRIRVTDDLNTSFEKSFIVHLRNVIEDMDGDKIEDHYDDDIDGDGFSNEVEKENGTDPTDPYILPKLPILETVEPSEEDKNNTVFLSGRVLANGDAKIEDFGILLSRSIEYSSDDSSTHWIRGKGKPDAFGVSLNDFKFTGVIYYRSWAKNVAGYGVGPVKKIEIAEPQERWWGKTRDLEADGNSRNGLVCLTRIVADGSIVKGLAGCIRLGQRVVVSGYGTSRWVGFGRSRKPGLTCGPTVRRDGCISSRDGAESRPDFTITPRNPTGKFSGYSLLVR